MTYHNLWKPVFTLWRWYLKRGPLSCAFITFFHPRRLDIYQRTRIFPHAHIACGSRNSNLLKAWGEWDGTVKSGGRQIYTWLPHVLEIKSAGRLNFVTFAVFSRVSTKRGEKISNTNMPIRSILRNIKLNRKIKF